MTCATISDVRSEIYTVQTDIEIQNILNSAELDLSGRGIESSHVRYRELHKTLSVIKCLERMQTNSELPYMSKLGGVQQMNSDIIKTIDKKRNDFEQLIKSVTVSSGLVSTYKISKQRISDYYE